MADVVKRVSRKGRGRRRNSPMSEINVTPFVDVMLVLVIIFMIIIIIYDMIIIHIN